MGLISPVTLPTPAELGQVHFIAIGGSGMNGIAAMLLESGVPVSGSDRQDSKYLRALEAAGARVYVGHRAEQLDQAQTVVASSAIREDNPELAEARRRGLRVLHRSAALGSLMLGRRGIAVAGTHGKTTTTAMIAHVLTGCGYDPSFVIGGAMTGSSTGGHLGSGELMVVEADESDGSFLQYPAEVAVVTNVDPDHLSNWGTAENYADGFLSFATGDQVRLVVVSADDPGAVALTDRLRSYQQGGATPLEPPAARATTSGSAPVDQQGGAAGSADIEIITFGESPQADVRIVGPTLAGSGSSFELHRGGRGGQVDLAVPGHYNVLNAAATYAVTTWLGADEGHVRRELSVYRGTYRRFQLVGSVNGVRVYDDYAHHPTEVRNTLVAARTAVGDGRVVVCFQPHLYTRTRDFWPQLAAALEEADQAVVMDVCGDREDPLPGIDGSMVAEAVRPGTAQVTYQPVWDEAAPTVAEIARPGDLVITVGCGDVTKVAPLIVAELRRRSGETP
jgi:UDP-N-acetylmuramate--alanine ligase